MAPPHIAMSGEWPPVIDWRAADWNLQGNVDGVTARASCATMGALHAAEMVLGTI
jgi:hypothetical protein